MRLVENWLLEMALSRIEPGLEVKSDVTLSAGGGLLAIAASLDVSRDMPGSPLRPEKTLSPDVLSSLLLLYAALPTPLSAVCLNHDGSRDPRDAAIWSRDGSTSGVFVPDPLVLLPNDTIETGLLPAPLELGRCCHDSVPERARLDALRAGRVEDVLESCDGAGLCDVGAVLLERLPLPNPLNSGTSCPTCCDVAGSIADRSEVEGVNGGGVSLTRVLAEGVATLGGVDAALTGLIDFARST